MTCREASEFIADYVSGALPASTRLRFAWHLLKCANCRRYIATYNATIAAGRAAYSDSDESAEGVVPEDLIQAILAARPESPEA